MGRSAYARRKEGGQELVEFALILPLLLLLIVGIFEFGYVVFAQNTLSNAVREGARYGSVKPGDEAGIIERARALTAGLHTDQLADKSSGEGDPGWTIAKTEDRITVSVEYHHPLLTGFIFQPLGFGDTLTLKASSSMGIE